MLNNLFESTSKLDDVALHHVIAALCKLSSEAMIVCFSKRVQFLYGHIKSINLSIGRAICFQKFTFKNNRFSSAFENFGSLRFKLFLNQVSESGSREPSYFPVAKLQQTGMVNLSRIAVFWKPVTAHLIDVSYIFFVFDRDSNLLLKSEKTSEQNFFLQVSGHPNSNFREWGAQALTVLVKSAMKSAVYGDSVAVSSFIVNSDRQDQYFKLLCKYYFAEALLSVDLSISTLK